MKMDSMNTNMVDKFQARYADWMNAQNQNDYYRARTLVDVREAAPNNKAFNDFLTRHFGYSPKQISEAGRILKAFQVVQDKMVWNRIGYYGVRRISEIKNGNLRNKIINKIKNQPEDTRISYAGMTKLISQFTSQFTSQFQDYQGQDYQDQDYRDEDGAKSHRRSRGRSRSQSHAGRETNSAQNSKTGSKLAYELSTVLLQNGIDPSAMFNAINGNGNGNGNGNNGNNGNNGKSKSRRNKSQQKTIALSV